MTSWTIVFLRYFSRGAAPPLYRFRPNPAALAQHQLDTGATKEHSPSLYDDLTQESTSLIPSLVLPQSRISDREPPTEIGAGGRLPTLPPSQSGPDELCSSVRTPPSHIPSLLRRLCSMRNDLQPMCHLQEYWDQFDPLHHMTERVKKDRSRDVLTLNVLYVGSFRPPLFSCVYDAFDASGSVSG